MALARRQNSVVTHAQLVMEGLTRHQIGHRITDGRLQVIHRGVYLVGAIPSEHAYAQAALLALGNEAILSHFSAAKLWKLREYSETAHPWVTIPASQRTERARIEVRHAEIAPVDRRRRYSMSLTSPPRTVLDLAGVVQDAYEVEALLAEAQFRRLANKDEMEDQLSRNRGKRGIAVVRHVLDLPGGPRRTRSKGERAFLRLLREERIDGYETNSKAFGPELDFVWPRLKFAVEVDGWDGHSGSVAFERDRLKIAELQARGIEVMPVTGRQIDTDRTGVINRLRGALAHRRALYEIDGRLSTAMSGSTLPSNRKPPSTSLRRSS